MLVVNLFAGPGAGKSTTAAGLFHLMKLDGMSCELVTEFAKDLVWDDRNTEDQLHILGEQHHRLHRLRNKVKYIVTDSPLFLSIVYGQLYMPQYKHYNNFVNEVVKSFDNYNVFIKRVKEYVPIGRNQTKAEAVDLDTTIKTALWCWHHPIHIEVIGDLHAPAIIWNALKKDSQL